MLTVFLAGKIFQHVFANQLLRGAVARVSFRHDGVGVRFVSSVPGANIRPPTKSRPVREINRPTMPPVRDFRIEYGVTMT